MYYYVLKVVTESDEVDRELHKDIEGEVRIIDNKLLSKITENSEITQKLPYYDAAVALVDKKYFILLKKIKTQKPL